MMEDRRELLRKIPKIDEVLQDERLFFFTESTPRAVIVDSVREVIDELRKDILLIRSRSGAFGVFFFVPYVPSFLFLSIKITANREHLFRLRLAAPNW